MSLYSERVAQDSPLFYFENNSSGVNNTGSITPSIITGSSTAFTSTGGVQNGPYMVNAAKTGEYGFEYSNSTTIFNDRVFSITGWFKVASTDIDSTLNWIFHAGTTANGITLQKTTQLYVGALFNGVQVNTSSAISYDVWHHVAVTMDTTNLKLYLDGSLVHTVSSPASLTMDSLVKYWMRATTSGTPRNGAKGNFDEWAVFNTTLSATTIEEHVAAGFGVDFHATPLTASALAVNPEVSAIKNVSYTATPVTASAASGDHYNSTRDSFTLLGNYMDTLTLEQRYKFDQPKSIINYGTGSNNAYIYVGDSRNDIVSGVQGSGALRITGSNSDVVASLGIGSADSFTDDDFSLGFWVKKTTTESAVIYSAHADVENLTIEFNSSGQIRANAYLNSNDHAITTSADYTDGNWHYVAVRLASGTMQLWVDGTSIGTINFNHSMADFYLTDFGAGQVTPTELMYVSDFYIATSANVTSTQIANIWSYGQATLQGGAAMVMPKFSRNNSLNNYIETRSPVFYFKMDQATGLPLNYGSADISLSVLNSSYTQNIPSPNYKAYNFTNRDTQFTGAWSTTTGTFTADEQQTIVIYTKFNSGNASGLFCVGAFGAELGSGLLVQQLANGTVRLRINDASYNNFITTSTSYADGNYHMIVGVKDGSDLTLYIDGAQVASGTASALLSDAGQLAIGGLSGAIPPSGSRDVTLDELAVFDQAFTAAEAFDIYQAVAWATDWTATATIVAPAVAAGFGPIIAADESTATASMGPVFPPIAPATANALFLNPNYEAIKNVSNSVTVWTASAQGENPGWNVGENNVVLHMNASAAMGDARARIPGFWNANPAIANPALMVEPALSTTLGALIKPQSLNAKGMFSTPPAYILLSDDKWFERLLEQNGDRAIEPVQANLTNLPNEQSQDVIKGGFLAFFNSLALNITTTSIPNSIENQIPNYYFTKQDEYQYDSEGNILDVDTSKNIARSGAGRSSTSPTPLLSIGTYDNRERKAVNINNIEFALPGTSRNYSNRYYNLEFSFKANKKDQIISHGFYTSPTSNIRRIGVIGLSDGKIYLATDNFDPASFTFAAGISGSVTAPHPKKNAKEYLIAKTDVADGEWHHIIIQYGYEDGRTQIWVDSKLERQYNVRPEDGGTTQTDVLGFNGTNTIRPYIIGFNSSEEILRSEFETSGWNFSPGRFISSQDVLLNYAAYDKYDPIKAEPMAATTTMTEDNNGSGNKKKALLLYWWPQDRQTYLSEPQIFDTDLTTIDNPKSAPQEFEGWDVFPLSVTGRHGLSDILNKSVVKTNAGYINLESGSPRMLDLINDVDIDQFDAIFFKNYPETSDDIDEYIRNEYVDKYFGLTEKDLYEQFLLSLRAAVDTGVSLYVTSKQLALDLKIVKTFNFIPTFDDRFKDTPLSIEFPKYAGNDIRSIELTNANNWDDETNSIKPTIELRSKYAINDKNSQYWPDRNNNMRHRVLNQVEYLTDDSTYIFTDRAFYQNDDDVDFLAPNRHYQRFEYRLNGLQIGDEFVFGNPSYKTSLGNSRSNQNNGFWAVHKDDILAGIPITGQPIQYYSQNELVDNPYKDYVHSIALQPGTTLNGKGLGGKIFVSISEVFWDETLETSIVDLVTDYWIDIAYENGILGPVGSLRAMSTRDRYKTAAQYISEDDKTTEKYDFLTYWSRNDDYAFTQTDQGDQFAGTIGLLFDDIEKVGKVPNTRSSLPSSARARDSLGRFASGASGASGGTLWFKAVTGRFTPTMNVYVPNILTRGFWWLSDRIRLNGLVVRATPMTASSSFVNANAVPDKDTTILSQSMVSSATLASPSNYSFADIKIAILPMNASAEIVKPGKQIIATPMLAVSQFKNPGVATTGEEEVVLIIDNKIAEVYIREDKIK